jgi:tRNA threonylcarbamoyladenosine biosynthesis protein TsaB
VSAILAVDTTSENGSVALLKGEAVMEEIALESSDGFAHVLFPALEKLLARHGMDWRSIDVFACASGPGAFTGVRVGLAAVKGLAEATGRKVIAVSNLQALAWFGTAPLRATLMDARRGDIFGAVYSAALEVVCAEVVMPLEEWLRTLPAGEMEFISAGISLEVGDGVRDPVKQAPRLLAGAIARIAASRLEAARDPAEIDANYVRRSDAELRWKD